MRPLRIEFEGAFYHVISRGNAGQAIFLQDADRFAFLETLSGAVQRFFWVVHAYCLMPNHYHLLLETPHPNLSKGMQYLNGAYSQAFNRMHRRIGHVFHGRFKSIVVDRDAYLMELARYIALNPVKAGFTTDPRSYSWSSCRAASGHCEKPDFLDVDFLLSLFDDDLLSARKIYKAFLNVEKGQVAELEARGGIVLSGDSFLESLGDSLQKKRLIYEIPRGQRFVDRPDLQHIFKDVYDRELRNRLIYLSHTKYGYPQRAIADQLRLSSSAISEIIKKQDKA